MPCWPNGSRRRCRRGLDAVRLMLIISTSEVRMPTSTVNFSVPLEIKEAFNAAFAGENKSAIIARLMQEAVEERKRLDRRAAAIDAILAFRANQEPVTDEEIREARHKGRP